MSLIVKPPPPTLSNLSYSFLPATRNNWQPTPLPTLYAPTNQQVYCWEQRPLFSQSACQQGYHKTSPFFLGYKNRHGHTLSQCWLSLVVRKSSCCISSTSILINSSFFSLHALILSRNSSSNHVHRPGHEAENKNGVLKVLPLVLVEDLLPKLPRYPFLKYMCMCVCVCVCIYNVYIIIYMCVYIYILIVMFFRYSWFIAFCQFCTIQHGDPVIHAGIHSFFSHYYAPS